MRKKLEGKKEVKKTATKATANSSKKAVKPVKGADIPVTTFKNTKLNVVKTDWKQVYYTNCPLISASNVDQGTWMDS